MVNVSMGEEKTMQKRKLLRNSNGQVLGLPMYLIIVMIVAVAVIAAVIYMIPQGTRTLMPQITGGAVLTGDGTLGEVNITDNVEITVISNDDNRDPVSDATVIVTGLGGTTTLTDNGDGTYSGSVTATLAPNVNEANLKLIVKAPGFEDYEDEDGIVVLRG